MDEIQIKIQINWKKRIEGFFFYFPTPSTASPLKIDVVQILNILTAYADIPDIEK